MALRVSIVAAALTVLPTGAATPVRAGYEQFPPYLIPQPGGAEPRGLAQEAFREAARRADVAIEWVRLPLNGAEKALVSGQIDIYPLLTVTEERKERIRYGTVWAENHLALVSSRDEFTLLAENVKDEASAIRIAEKLGDCLAAPFDVWGQRAAVGASIGISFFPLHGVDASVLQCNADAAMYEAKRAGKNAIRVFQPGGATAAGA